MPKRRRYATRDELAELLAGRGVPKARHAIEVLADLGVPVDALVKIEVDEEI